jgi:hypothetical protein
MKRYSLLLLILIFSSCKINQKSNGLRDGKWITTDSVSNDMYKYVEKYKKGEEVKTWKTFKNNKIYKKEKHKKLVCEVTYFGENKKTISKGQTKIEESVNKSHWFYFGEWKYYNNKGKLILLKNYENGELKSETEIK